MSSPRQLVKKFFKDKRVKNTLGIAVTIITVTLGILMPANYYSYENKLDKDYNFLATEGKKITGNVVQYARSMGSAATKDQSLGEGFAVEIEYKNDAGLMQRISETWPTYGKMEMNNRMGQSVDLFYREQNELVKAASVEAARMRTALQIIKNREN